MTQRDVQHWCRGFGIYRSAGQKFVSSNVYPQELSKRLRRPWQAQLIYKSAASPPFLGPACSLPCAQQPAAGSYAHTLIPWHPFNIILPSMLRKWPLPFRFCNWYSKVISHTSHFLAPTRLCVYAMDAWPMDSNPRWKMIWELYSL